MDIAGIINSLSTSGAQWYNLVAAPGGSYNPNIPAFTQPSAGAIQAQAATQAVKTGSNLLLVGVLFVGAIFLIKAIK